MKWLFLLLLTINVILFVVQIKEKDKSGIESDFNKVAGAQEIKLLKDVNNDAQHRCVVIGAIPDQNILDAVAKFLTDNRAKFEILEKETVLAPSYWVYVVDDAEEALMQILKKMKLDSYLIASGQLKGKLSVGLFENIDLAQDMINSLKENGVNADLVEKRKIKNTRWISFEVNDIGGGEHIIEALKNMEINLGEIKEFFCKSIASEK